MAVPCECSMQLTELQMREESEHHKAHLWAGWAELGLEGGPGMWRTPWVPQRLLRWHPLPL